MNSKNKVVITYGLWLLDMVTIAVSFVLSCLIRFGGGRADMRDKNVYILVCLLCVLVATVYTFVVPWHNYFMTRKPIKELWHILKMNILTILIVQMAMFALKWADLFSRWVMAYFFVISVSLIFVVHLLFKQGMKAYYRSEFNKTKVLVITDADLKESVTRKLEGALDVSFQILDAINIDDIDDRFFEDAMQMAVDEVFVLAPEADLEKIGRIVRFFDEMGVECNYCMELRDISSGSALVSEFGGYSVLKYTHFHSSYKRLLLKRIFDIFGSIIGCLVTIIVTPFVAIAIKVNSPGPVFFKQVRMGRNGRKFKIIKFRSMYIDAEERKKELEKNNEMKGPIFKAEDDPRITRVGDFLRKTSIDELPQFFNILKGDMSLVGTRPPTADEFEEYSAHYRRRLSMTPGLTGMWQVSGRSNIKDFDAIVKLDLEYIDNWSLSLDAKILLKTIKVVFTRKGSK